MYNTHWIRVNNTALYLCGTLLKQWTMAEKTNPL
jgi:hypothetical protein